MLHRMRSPDGYSRLPHCLLRLGYPRSVSFYPLTSYLLIILPLDYLNDSPTLIQNSKNAFDTVVVANGANPAVSNFLVIGHDVHQQTAFNLTGYILARMQTLGYGSVTVGQCLGDPSANWYRSAGSAVPSLSSTTKAGTSATSKASSTTTGSTATAVSKKISPDATCSGTNGYTCQDSTFGSSPPLLYAPTVYLR